MLWEATVVSNIGSWMQSAAAGWLMTTLSPEPLKVATVQAATTLPTFLFSLPAGALADIVDRRHHPNSWLEHMRQHQRATNADRVLQDAVHRFQGESDPAIRHLIAAQRSEQA